MIRGSELIATVVLVSGLIGVVRAYIGKHEDYRADVASEVVAIRRYVQIITIVALLLAFVSLTGCVMTTKVVEPDHRTDAKGNVTYYGELPERLLTENDCIGIRAVGAPCIAPTQEEVEKFPAEKLAWTEAHTKEVPMWGCTFFDWATTAVGIVYYGAVETNPLGVAFAVGEGIVANKIAKDHAAKGDGAIAKASAGMHCGLGVWNLGQIAKAL